MTDHGPRRLVLAVAVVVVIVTLILLPRLSSGPSPAGTTATTSTPLALSERAPFGVQFEAALAYYGANREFNLIDLRNGRQLGSKGVANDKRPVGATATAALLGNLPAGVAHGNWDTWQALPWQGTAATTSVTGNSIAYSQTLDLFAVTMRPLPQDGNGFVIVAEKGTRTATSSNGIWGFTTWIGDRVLVREAVGTEIRWWAMPTTQPGEAEQLALAADFRPIAGTDGLIMGELAGEGVIVDLATQTQSLLAGGWSWAAEWRPGADPLLATVGGTPPALFAYNRNGTIEWSRPLGEGTAQFHGGVAWSPDGSLVVAPGGRSIQAFTPLGIALGALDPALPAPESSDAGFVAVVSLPGE